MTPKIISVYPLLNQLNYTVNKGDTVTFECSASGIPPPTITWLRNERELNMATDDRVTVDDPTEMIFSGSGSGSGDGSLVITTYLTLAGTTESDSGSFTCVATNNAIPDRDEEDFELIVHGKMIV